MFASSDITDEELSQRLDSGPAGPGHFINGWTLQVDGGAGYWM